jgi:molecular chaperone GrpE
MKDEFDDIEIEQDADLDDSVVAEEAAGDTIKKLKDKLRTAEGKAKEYLDGWQRSQADFANLRKRDEEEKKSFVKYANAKLIEEMIPVLDALDLAVMHGDKGVEQTRDLLLKILKSNGLEVMNPVGETFDPNMHEAVAMQDTDKDEDDHKIIEVMQKGYMIEGKIIRAAKVKIYNK